MQPPRQTIKNTIKTNSIGMVMNIPTFSGWPFNLPTKTDWCLMRDASLASLFTNAYHSKPVTWFRVHPHSRVANHTNALLKTWTISYNTSTQDCKHCGKTSKQQGLQNLFLKNNLLQPIQDLILEGYILSQDSTQPTQPHLLNQTLTRGLWINKADWVGNTDTWMNFSSMMANPLYLPPH